MPTKPTANADSEVPDPGQWQFWIDVGGTFTDCLAVSPEGQEHLAKVLSSGATKGTIQQWLSPSSFVMAKRTGDGEDFWSGAAIRFFDCLLYTSPSPRDQRGSRMPSSA